MSELRAASEHLPQSCSRPLVNELSGAWTHATRVFTDREVLSRAGWIRCLMTSCADTARRDQGKPSLIGFVLFRNLKAGQPDSEVSQPDSAGLAGFGLLGGLVLLLRFLSSPLHILLGSYPFG